MIEVEELLGLRAMSEVGCREEYPWSDQTAMSAIAGEKVASNVVLELKLSVEVNQGMV